MKHLALRLGAFAACSIAALAANALAISTTTPAGVQTVVDAISDNVIKVTYSFPNQPVNEADTPNLGGATATVYSPNADAEFIVTVSGLSATLNKATGAVVIDGGAPNKVLASQPTIKTADGRQQLNLLTTAKGSYYGAGERGHKLNLRGDTLVMYNRQNYGYGAGDPRISQMNITMPLLLASDGFAVVFDDFAAAWLYASEGAEITYSTEGKTALSYYFVNGESTLQSVTENLTALTGRQPLPPLWSLGYITSKYGYRTQAETLGVVDTLKRNGYPLDGIVLDLYWYGKEQDMGRLAWDPQQWPDPKKMLSTLAKQGVNLVAISQPYLLRNGRGADNYNTLAAAGMLVADSTGTTPQEVKIWVGEGGMFDASNPATRQWLANRYDSLTAMGIAGWWGDLGEPEVHPESALHHNGLTARLYHNKYGNDWSKTIYDMMRQKYPDKRVMTMMRGGTTGLQKYGVFPWSTDVSRSWQGLQPQVTIMQGSGLSGLGYMGHDVGGFAVDPQNPVDPELYVRWLQLGLFSPVLRTHAQVKAEPYNYPQYADIILDLVRQRYRWLPYNYTLAYQNAAFGYPLVRPLNFNEPGAAYDSISDQFLWGSEVMVAPVMQQGRTSRPVTFPAGLWVDMANPSATYQGGTTVSYPAPIGVLPLFVRAGSFIPTADYKMQNTADYNPGHITVSYYPRPGVDSQYTMYDDDRLSPTALADGQYRLITFTGKALADGSATVTIASEGSYKGAPAKVDIDFAVCGLDKAPGQVTVNGKKAKFTFSAGTLKVKVQFTPGTESVITYK